MPIIVDFVGGKSITEQYSMVVGNNSSHVTPANYGYNAFNDKIINWAYGSITPNTFTFDKIMNYTIGSLSIMKSTDDTQSRARFILSTSSTLSVTIKSIIATFSYGAESIVATFTADGVWASTSMWMVNGTVPNNADGTTAYSKMQSWNGKTVQVTLKVNF